MDNSKFFKAAKRNSGTVDVDGFGVVEVKEFTLKQRLSLSDIAEEDVDVMRAKVVVMCCDIFSDDDIESLCEIRSEVLLELFNMAMTLSGMGETKKKP